MAIPRNIKADTLDERIPNAAPRTVVPINGSGVAALTQASHKLAAESGTADTVTSFTVTPFEEGDTIKITADAGDTITIDGSISDTGLALELTETKFAYVHVGAGGAYKVSLGGGGSGGVATLDSFAGASDTAKLQAAAAGSNSVTLTRDMTLTGIVNLPAEFVLNLNGWTITKGYNGDMFTMGKDARIVNGQLEGAGATYSGRGIFITGGGAISGQTLDHVVINGTRDYCIEFDGTSGGANDGSGTSFKMFGGWVFRYDWSLPAIGLPVSEGSTYGVRSFIGVHTNGADFLDVRGGRVTSIIGGSSSSVTLGDSSAYFFVAENRVVQAKDRRAITGITQANPARVTSVNHGLATGNKVLFRDIGGMTQMNAVYTPNTDNPYTVSGSANQKTITVINANEFDVDGVNSTGYGAYTSGGTFENLSTHMIRGNNHHIEARFGTSVDGSSHLTLAKDATDNYVWTPETYTLVDNSTNLTNATPNEARVYSSANAPYQTIDLPADNLIAIRIKRGANDRLYIGTDASGNTTIDAYNGNLEHAIGGTTVLTISAAALTVAQPIQGSGVISGTYTPTASALSNCDSVTPSVWKWSRLGNIVTLSGVVDVDLTAAGQGSFELTLPIASNFTANSDASGGCHQRLGNNVGAIYGQTTNDKLGVVVNTATTTAVSWDCIAQYEVK